MEGFKQLIGAPLLKSKHSCAVIIIALILLIAAILLTIFNFVIPRAAQKQRDTQLEGKAVSVVGYNPGPGVTEIARSASSPPGNGCSITKNSDGSYSYSWLHVDASTGYFMGEHNCIVDLRGFEFAGLEYGDATAGGLNEQRIAWFNRTFRMNYVRIPLNASWWNNDVFVPHAKLHYRAWIEQVINWTQNNGDYVLLNRAAQFSAPPCGGSITFCPSQNTPADNPLPTSPQDVWTGHFLDVTRQFWSSIVPLYANNPAVLYDQWNELHDVNPQTWQAIQNDLVATIRVLNPRSLIMLGGRDWNNTMDPIVDGAVPDFTQPNLVYDWHIYNGYTGNGCAEPGGWMWIHWGAGADRQIAFAHTHGHAVAFNEWGGAMISPGTIRLSPHLQWQIMSRSPTTRLMPSPLEITS